MTATSNRETAGEYTGKAPAVVVVGDEAARSLAASLDESATVIFAGTDETVVRRAAADGQDAHHVDATDASSLQSVAEVADVAIVVLEPERTALLAAQLLQSCCGIDDVVAVISTADYLEAFAATDIALIDSEAWLLDAVQTKLAHIEWNS